MLAIRVSVKTVDDAPLTTAATDQTRDPTLRFEGDRVIKRQHPEQSRRELERTRLAAQIAATCGLFDVPEILSYDGAAGEIVFRYVHDSMTLREYLVRRPDSRLMARVGQALAAIHDAGVVPRECAVFWHGDYGVGNVLYSEERDRITIIDWANAKWTLEPIHRSCGNPGFDLGGALIALFHHRPFGHMYIPKLESRGSALLHGYARERSCFSIESALPLMRELIRRRRRYWISQRGVLKNLAYEPSLVRLQIFLHRIRSRLH